MYTWWPVGVGIVLGVLSGWFLRHFTLFREGPATTSNTVYEVLLSRPAKYGKLSTSLYAGGDLQMAKTMFKAAKIPHNCIVELYTRGHHTASRKS